MEKHSGTYALILTPNGTKPIKIGKLGMLQVRAGFYIYVGSAFGPRWHIDYLRTVTHLKEWWYSYDPRRREHQWADIISGARGITVPFPGFGSSDCNCKSHLYFLKSKPTIESFRRRVRASIEDQEKVLIKKIKN
jgi:Uri superfamily endonuclease